MVIRPLPSGVSNVKHLAFDTPNTKKPLSWGVLNTKIFYMSEHYYLKYRSIWTTMVKVLLFFYSLFSLFSHHFIPFFFSLLSYSSSDIPINPYLLLSLFFLLTVVAFLSLSTLPRHLLNLMLIFVVVGFFFFLQ